MPEFRYDDRARKFDEELGIDLLKLQAEKQAKLQEKIKPEPSGIQRIAEGKTPLDEVRALIDASRQKSAQEEVAEYRVQAKLAEIRQRESSLVDRFLGREAC